MKTNVVASQIPCKGGILDVCLIAGLVDVIVPGHEAIQWVITEQDV